MVLFANFFIKKNDKKIGALGILAISIIELSSLVAIICAKSAIFAALFGIFDQNDLCSKFFFKKRYMCLRF